MRGNKNLGYKSDSESDSDGYEKKTNSSNSSNKNYDLTKLKNVNLDYCFNVNTSSKINGQMKNIDKAELNRSLRVKDRSDRATVEQVLDARVSRILYKLINKGEITEINGCISTGKEANVYYAKGAEGKELALKIYKTSILIFKDRDRYISGEFRFRHGYCKSNPRKMVALWAEKEVRNLKRINLAGIKSPLPLILKSNLIVMEFLGKNGVAAPRLKDAELESSEEWEELYQKIIIIMRILFKDCKLVHADFSEYNLLYYEKEVYVIDVAQAVEDFHPNALGFLKRDCHNVNMYFERNGVNTITDQQLFDIVSAYNNNKFDKDHLLNILIKYREENVERMKENKKFKEIENGLFTNFEIPRSLQEEDVDKITGNSEIEEALSKLCGVVKKENEKELIIPKRNEEGKIILKEKNLKVNKKQKIEEQQKDNFSSLEENIEKSSKDNQIKTLEIDENNLVVKNKNNTNIEDEYDEVEEDEYNEGEESYSDDENLSLEMKEKLDEGGDEEPKKGGKHDPFEGLSKQERKKKVKAENRDKRANKKMTKYEKSKAVKKSSGKK